MFKYVLNHLHFVRVFIIILAASSFLTCSKNGDDSAKGTDTSTSTTSPLMTPITIVGAQPQPTAPPGSGFIPVPPPGGGVFYPIPGSTPPVPGGPATTPSGSPGFIPIGTTTDANGNPISGPLGDFLSKMLVDYMGPASLNIVASAVSMSMDRVFFLVLEEVNHTGVHLSPITQPGQPQFVHFILSAQVYGGRVIYNTIRYHDIRDILPTVKYCAMTIASPDGRELWISGGSYLWQLEITGSLSTGPVGGTVAATPGYAFRVKQPGSANIYFGQTGTSNIVELFHKNLVPWGVAGNEIFEIKINSGSGIFTKGSTSYTFNRQLNGGEYHAGHFWVIDKQGIVLETLEESTGVRNVFWLPLHQSFNPAGDIVFIGQYAMGLVFGKCAFESCEPGSTTTSITQIIVPPPPPPVGGIAAAACIQQNGALLPVGGPVGVPPNVTFVFKCPKTCCFDGPPPPDTQKPGDIGLPPAGGGGGGIVVAP